MTNFLPAGIINDTVNEVYQKTRKLKEHLTENNKSAIKQELTDIEEMVLDLMVFLQHLSCQPLIYTGKGSTEEVIKRLDWALTFTENIDAIEYINNKQHKKSNTK